MKFTLYKSLWGAVGSDARHATFADVVPAVADEGWDGVVFALIAHQFEPGLGETAELADRCAEQGLETSYMLHTFGDTVDDHLADLRTGLESLASLEPHHVICHGGSDAFEFDDAIRFMSSAVSMADDLGLRVGHETHRSRVLFNPWITARILDEVPKLDLVVDLSHWVVVAERLITDAETIITQCATRAIHIDARVGHEQGPQVPDPSAPEWSDHVATFERWWSLIWDTAAAAGRDELVFVPEYGPPPYQQTLPRTGERTSDLWSVARDAGSRLRETFGSRSA